MLQQTSLLAEHMTAADQSQLAIYFWTNQVTDTVADQPSCSMTAANQLQLAIYRWTNQVPDAAADQPSRRKYDCS
jgi:hypothetical protein